MRAAATRKAKLRFGWASDGPSDEVSLSFKGEQFKGFSVFASPAPPVRRKSSKDLK